MMTLVEFLRARLDEDEQRVRVLADPAAWPPSVVERARANGPGSSFLPLTPDEAAYIAHQAPARVLAEVEAKRRLVAEYVAADERAKFPDFDGGVASGLDDALRIVAMPYAGHDNYQDEWRPDWPAPAEQP